MKKYKVEITVTSTYVFDAMAKDEETAIEIAKSHMSDQIENGTLHYYQTSEQTAETVYDVTGTDDALADEDYQTDAN